MCGRPVTPGLPTYLPTYLLTQPPSSNTIHLHTYLLHSLTITHLHIYSKDITHLSMYIPISLSSYPPSFTTTDLPIDPFPVTYSSRCVYLSTFTTIQLHISPTFSNLSLIQPITYLHNPTPTYLHVYQSTFSITNLPNFYYYSSSYLLTHHQGFPVTHLSVFFQN